MQRGWYPVGKTRFTPVALSRNRIHVLGAMYDGELDMEFHGKIDSDAVEAFPRRRLARRGTVIAILGNASAHHAGNVKRLEEESSGRLVLARLPPCTPELNSIEIRWRVIRKAIADAVFAGAGALEEAIRGALLSSDALIVSIASYAKDKNAPAPRWCTARIGDRVLRTPYYN